MTLVGGFEKRGRAILRVEKERDYSRDNSSLSAIMENKALHATCRNSYVSSGIDLRASFQQPPHNVIVPHLCRNPQRRGAVRSRRVGLRPVFQQNFQDTKVAVLSGDKQRRSAILSDSNHS